MNLAILIGRFPPDVYGGAELQAEQWAKRLAARHHVTVVTRKRRPDDAGREHRDGFEVVRLPVSGLPFVRAWVDRSRIDRAAAALAPPPAATLCFQTFISGWAGVRIQKRRGIPAVVWVRGEDEYRIGSRRTRAFSVPVWDAAAAVLVQTASNRERVLEAVRRFRPAAEARISGKLEVIPNGLELPGATLAESAGPRPWRGILSVGRLIPDKGMDVVIDAVAGIQGLLTIAGAGPERQRLEARARHHGLDVRFEGAVPRERLAACYAAATCVVLASRRGEGLPNVLLEAFAHGRPVVATAVTGVTDLVRDGENGLLVPPGDPLALRAALARLEHERGLAERLGAAGRATAATYAWERVLPMLEAVLARRARS